MSCIRRIISDIDGRNSTTQNSANNAIIIILNTFTVVGRQVRLIIRSIKSATIITELARTHHQNSEREVRPLKSKALVQNSLNPSYNFISVLFVIISFLCR